MEEKNKKDDDDYEYHVLAIPYPSQGHINPMLHFCKRLAFYGSGRIKTTLATTVYIANTFSPDPSSTSPVNFATFSDGFDRGGFATADSVSHYLDALQSAGSRTLADLINGGSRVDCVIYDAFLPWALQVAKRFGVQAAAFFTQACAVNFVYYLIHHGRLSLPVPAFPIPVGGLHVLSSPRDMPSFVGVPGSYPAYFQMVLSQFSNADRADFILVNSVYELEQEAVDSMSELCPLLTIGPTIPSMYLDKRIHNDNNYGFNLFVPDSQALRDWLDAKPARSVVYVSFGSMACLSPEQMEELAMGLRSSGCHFLWVVRSSEEWKLDAAAVERDKGLMANWTPQLEVLSHKAVGCFFTHCGWNSTVEALSVGVPMVGMPQWTDQPTDAVLVQELWKVGVRVAVDEATGIVGRDEIERCIRHVMGSDEMRANARKWSRHAVQAVSHGGSSDINIRHFISQLQQN